MASLQYQMYSLYSAFSCLYRVKFRMDNLSYSRSACEFEYWNWLSQEELFSVVFGRTPTLPFSCISGAVFPSFYDGRSHERCCSHFSIWRFQSQHTVYSGCKTNILCIPVAKPSSYCICRLHNLHHTIYSGCKTNILYNPVAQPTSYCTFLFHNHHYIFWRIFAFGCNFEAAMFTRIWIGYRLWSVGNWRSINYRVYWASLYYYMDMWRALVNAVMNLWVP